MFVVTLYSHGISLASNIDHTNNNFGLFPSWGAGGRAPAGGLGAKPPEVGVMVKPFS